MCGIVGYAGVQQAAPVLLAGLERLAYRGYDSAGIAVQGDQGIVVIKAKGRIENLAARTRGVDVFSGRCGIGHTRWATHGKPDEANAHPHASLDNRVVMVHNGIIENSASLREELASAGYAFRSETDTEAAVLLLDKLYAASEEKGTARALNAIIQMMTRLRGSYAMGILFGDQPDVIYAVRMHSPLAVGVAEDGTRMLASDVSAMVGYVQRVVHMEDGEIACIRKGEARFYAASGKEIEKQAEQFCLEERAIGKDGYAHFMLKEIYEQPEAVRRTITPYLIKEQGGLRVDLGAAGMDAQTLARIKRLYFIGCGSAYHAGCVGREAVQRLAHIACESDLASELRYGEPVFEPDALAVVISQSGETADSLAALRLCKAHGLCTLAIVNVPQSAMAREADAVLLTKAGPEISVATTKAYAAQLAALYLLAIAIAVSRGTIGKARETQLAEALLALPEKIREMFSCEKEIKRLAGELAEKRDAFFIGRGLDYAVCLEGSLKLKEISYIHAEAYAAGELKHGTISLIEEGVPVVCLATQKELLSNTLTNMEEAKSRGAKPLLLISKGLCAATRMDDMVLIGDTDELFAASLAVIPLQLLAYHVSCMKGLDVDKPRNLAKAVTVE